MSGINLTSGQSAITTDAQGVTHIVWYDSTTNALFTASYDVNSQTWQNTQLVAQFATAQNISNIQLLSSNTIINNSNGGSPGLVAVWQQGDAKSSNFYYTAAQYDQNENLQWLNNPQLVSTSATTNTSTTPTSAVSNLNPTAQVVINGATGSSQIALVGEKVNLQNRANLGVRAGTNLYVQNFSVNSSQFDSNNAPESSTIAYAENGNNPDSTYQPVANTNGVLITPIVPSTTSALALANTNNDVSNANTSMATPAAASNPKSSGYGLSVNGQLNWNSDVYKDVSATLPDAKILKDIVKAFTDPYQLIGTLQAGQTLANGQNSSGNKNSNQFLVYSNAEVRIKSLKKFRSFNQYKLSSITEPGDAPSSKESTKRVSVKLSTKYYFGETKGFPLEKIKTSIAFSAGVKVPVYKIPLLFKIDFTTYIGLKYGLSAKTLPSKTSFPYSFLATLGVAGLANGAGAYFLGTATKNALKSESTDLSTSYLGGLIGTSMFATVGAWVDGQLNNNYSTEGTVTLPFINSGIKVELGNKITGLTINTNVEAGVNYLSNSSDGSAHQGSLYVDLPISAYFNIGPVGVGVNFDPKWTWNIFTYPAPANSSSQSVAPALIPDSLSLATASLDPTAQVVGSLLTLSYPFALSSKQPINPNQFDVEDINTNGNATSIDIFGVIVQGDNLILQLAHSVNNTVNYNYTDSSNPTPTPDTIEVSYKPSTTVSENVQDASGSSLPGFSNLNVNNNSPTIISTLYNPAAGDGSNYASTGYQMVLNFSTPLNTNTVPNVEDFTVSGNSVTAVQVQPYGIILSLANAPSANPLVTYTTPASSSLQDVLGNPIAGFSINSGITVSQTSNTTIFLSAFGATLNTGSTPSASQFSVSVTDVDGNITGTLQVTAVLVKSNGVQLTVSGKLDPNSSNINVSYTSNGSLQVTSGKQVGSFKASSLVAGLSPTTISSQSIVSNIEAALGNASSPTMAPNTVQGNTLLAWVNDAPPITPIAAIVSQGTNSSTASITLDFAGALTNTTNIPSASQFTISDQNGNSYSANNLQVLNDSVQLTLNQSVASDAQLNISYKLSPNSNAQNLAFSDATNPTLYVDNFSNFSVTNTIGSSSAPILLGAGSIVTSSNTNLITLAFNQTVSGSPLLSQFTVLVNGSSYTIKSVNAADNNTVTLSVTPPTGSALIAAGDLVTVSYNSNGNSLSGTNGTVASFTNQPVITSASTPTTVIQAGFGTVGNGGYSFGNISSIPGTDGFNFAPAAAQDQDQNDVVVWSHATSQDIPTNLLPGQFYTSNQTSIINNSLSQASIQYSIYNPHTQQWTIATGIPDMPFGANSKPTLGSGPNGNLMAVWLNNNSQAIVNGDYQLELQTSGEYSGQLTLVNNTNNTVAWNSGNTSGATEALMQSDGNLVLYSAPQTNTPNSSQIVWQSNTAGNAGAYLALDDNGNLEILSPTGVVLSQLYGAYNAALTTVNLSANQSVSNSTQIYESTLSYSGTTPSWSNPTLIYQDANPDPTSQLRISAVNNQPAVFWTQTQAPSYQELVANDAPLIYWRLDDPSGSTYANNQGSSANSGDAIYSGDVVFGVTGALTNPAPTGQQSGSGDLDPAATFINGASAELDGLSYSGESFSVDFWFNAASVESTNLVNISNLLGINLVDNSNQLELVWNLGSNSQSIASTNISTKAWHYVALTYDSSAQTGTLYLDGQPTGSPITNLNLAPLTTTAPIVINQNYVLALQSNGELDLDFIDANGNSTILWSGGYIGGANGQYSATMQSDGNFVVTNSAGNVVWSTGTSGVNNYLSLDSQGNLAIVNSNGALVEQLYGSAPDTSNSSNIVAGQSQSNQAPTSTYSNIILAGTPDSNISLDEYAFYDNTVLSWNNAPTNASTFNPYSLTTSQLTAIATGDNNDIGIKYASQYNSPIPSGPSSNYVTYNSSTNSWATPPSTVNLISTPIPTQLTNANAPTWDIVSNTIANAQGNINPNGTADQYFQYLLTGEQGNIIDGIRITVGSQTWGIGTLASGANQLGLVIGNKLLNSQNPNGASFSHTVLANQELLNLFIDNGSPTPDITNATITIDFANNPTSVTVNNQQSINSTYEPNGTSNTSVIGMATVTEANDATLGNIDSGFNINTNNPAVGAAFVSGTIAGKAGQTDVAVVNRGYIDSNGNQVSTGSIAILFGNGQVLQGSELNPLTATDLSGNPDGVLIEGFDDLGISNGGLPLSAALGYISSSTQEDLVIGDPNANNGQGVVYVIYGSYLAANPDTKINVTTLTSSQGYVINPANGSFAFGTTVAVGNFDGAGTNDIAIGAPSTNNGAGAVYIAYNPTSTNNAASSFYTGKTIVTTDNSTFTAGNYQLILQSSGQYNGQLTIVNTINNTVTWNSKNTTAATQALMNTQGQLVLSDANGSTIETIGTPGNPGSYLALDNNGNLAIVGAAGIVINSSNQLSGTTPNLSSSIELDANEFLKNDQNNYFYTNVGEAAGTALAVSHYSATNGNSFTGANSSSQADDLIVGAPNYSLLANNYWDSANELPNSSNEYPAQSYVQAGAVYVFNGSATPFLTYNGSNGPSPTDGAAENSNAGSALAVGNWNGTGQQDLAIGATGVSSGNGAVYVLAGGKAKSIQNSTAQQLPTVSNVIINGYVNGGQAGSVLTSVPDLTGQSNLDDLVVGSPLAANATGQSTVVFGLQNKLTNLALGTQVSISPTANASKSTLLLNGNQANQLSGSAAVGITENGQNNLLVATTGAQQISNVFGHPWLADVGSLQLANLCSNNGFVTDGSLGLNQTGVYQLSLGTDGNLYLINNQTDTQTNLTNLTYNFGVPIVATMQSDGNFVIYQGSTALWASNTSGNPGAYLTLDDQGNVAILSPSGTVLNQLYGTYNASNPYSQMAQGQSIFSNVVNSKHPDTLYNLASSGNPYQMVLDSYGILNLIDPSNKIVWSSSYSVTGANIPGGGQYIAIMQTDGNFVVYQDHSGNQVAVWASNTGGNSGAYLSLDNKGNLSIVSSSGTVLNQLYGTYNSSNPNVKLNAASTPIATSANSLCSTPTVTNSFPFNLTGNGSDVVMLGDLTGSGFADVASGGSASGAIITFGSTTQDLTSPANTKNLLVTINGATIEQIVSLGDINADGMQDFGVFGSDNNFYVLLGNANLANAGTLVLSADASASNTSDYFVIKDVTASQIAGGIGNFAGQGYGDFVIGNTLYMGGATGVTSIPLNNSPFSLSLSLNGHLSLNQFLPSSQSYTSIWSTPVNGNNVVNGGTYVAVMQADGNFVVYEDLTTGGSVPVWASGTYGNPGAYLALGANGNLAIIGPSGNVLNQLYGQYDSTLIFDKLVANQTITSSTPLSSFTNVAGIGDINGDGKQDVVSANPSANNYGGAFTIIQNNGTTTTIKQPNATLTNVSYTGSVPPTNMFTSWSDYGSDVIADPNNVNPSLNGLYAYTIRPPAFAVYNGWLYMVGVNEDYNLSITRTKDGYNWWPVQLLNNLGSGFSTNHANGGPSLAVFDGSLYLSFTNNSSQVEIARFTQDDYATNGIGIDINNPSQLQGNTSQNQPTLVAYNGQLYDFFESQDSSDRVLYTSSSTPSNASSGWSQAAVATYGNGTNQLTSSQIGAAVINNGKNGGAGTLLISYNGSGSGDTTVYSSTFNAGSWDGINNTNGQTVPNGSAPSLVSVGNTVYMFTRGNGNNTINIKATYDGSNWNAIPAVPNNGQTPSAVFTTGYAPSAVFFNQSMMVGYVPITYSNESDTAINFVTSNLFYDYNNLMKTGTKVVGVGDFNGDGIEDIAVLAPGATPGFGTGATNSSPNYTNSGEVFVYYGSTSGISTNASPDVVFALPNPTSSYHDLQINNIASAGDINGDGIDDLLISASSAPVVQGVNGDSVSNSGIPNTGVVYVVFGSSQWGTGVYTPTSTYDLANLNANQSAGGSSTNGFSILGLPGSQAGISLSGGADVNGDGLSDFVVGAPGNNDNLTYTIYGSDFNNTVNQTGTIGDDVMVGTPTGETLLGNEGNDQIYTNGGRDVVYAGPGNDLVTVSDTTFQRLDGGTDTNTLKFQGYNGQAWNLTTLSPGIRIKNFEFLDITNYGANTLTLNSLTVNNISSTGVVTVLMDSNDTLNLSSDFSYKGTVYDGNENLYQYSSSTTKAEVLVYQSSPNIQPTVTYSAPSTNTPQSILASPTATVAAQAALSESSPSSTTTSDNNLLTNISITSPTVSASDGTVTFMVNRTGNTSDYLAARYFTIDAGAKAGLNYDAAAGQIVFEPGQVNKTITVTLPEKQIYTGKQQFQVEAAITKESSNPISSWSVELTDTNGSLVRQWTHDLTPTVALPTDTVNSLSNTTGEFDFYATANNKGQATLSFKVTGDPKANGIYVQNANGKWVNFVNNGSTGVVINENSDGTKAVTLNFQDGGRGDADSAVNGVIKVSLAITNSPLKTVVGTPLKDTLTGSSQGTQIIGLGGGDTLTGTAGLVNEFTYTSAAETGSIITNFQTGKDVINLTEVLDSLNYQGSDPIADHYLGFKQIASGTFVTLDTDGLGTKDIARNFIFVKGVSENQLHSLNNFVF